MTQIDFYVLPENAPRPLNDFVAKLTEQLYRRGHRMHIHTAHLELSQQIDDALWTARDISFVPHDLASNASADSVISIGEADCDKTDDVLINLAPLVPEFFSRYQRVVEVISGDPQQRQLGRERYRFYRDRGYELNLHNLS